ncbi:ChaN family lipoprotein, partial [Escherichia coli]
KPFVFLGENHATTDHQKMESAVIEALQAAKRKVVVGLEMFTRPKQDVLDEWSAGSLSEDAFLEKAEWKTQWGYPYHF